MLLAENRVIGGIGLTGPPFETGETMVGYAISKPYQNSGFAAEALQCLLSWAFQNLQLQAIFATTPTNNIASHRVLQKNNFVNLGLQDEYIHWRQERD